MSSGVRLAVAYITSKRVDVNVEGVSARRDGGAAWNRSSPGRAGGLLHSDQVSDERRRRQAAAAAAAAAAVDVTAMT